MIFQLLKQLPPAMGRFLAYRMRIMLRGKPPAQGASAPHLEVAAPVASEPMSQPAKQPAVAAAVALPAVELDPRYLALTDWPTYREQAELPELLADPLFQLWLTIPNGHKWSNYFESYRRVFEDRREKPLRILEIGVYLGSGLSLWRQYFKHPDTLVVGVDIQANCAQFAAPQNNIEVRIGSQTDEVFLRQVVAEFGPFDIIIDDGSHNTAHQIKSFNYLFEAGLKPGGLYLVEDLHASYWPRWRDSEKTFFDLSKDLIELMHAHYRRDDLPQVFARDAPDQHASIQVPAITTMLGEIRVFDSIVVIERVERAYVPYYVTLEQQSAGSSS